VIILQTMVQALTKEDISCGKYSISDIVYPLPGHDITYPNNVIAEWYREYLAEDDLSSEKLKQKLK
jgi:tRNA pseudouridine13 synthase